MSSKFVIHAQFSHLVCQLIALQEEWYCSALSCCTKMDKDQHFSESLLLPIYFIGLVESGDKWQTGFCSCSICQEDWLTQSFPRDPCASSWSWFCYTETAGFRWQVSVCWVIHFCYHISLFLFIVQFALGYNLFLTKAWFRSHTSHNLSHIKQKIEFDLAYVNYSMWTGAKYPQSLIKQQGLINK